MNRRGFLKAIFAAGAAPAFVKADSLMKIIVPSQGLILPEQEIVQSSDNQLVTLSIVTKEALKMLNQSLVFTNNINAEYEKSLIVGSSTINVKLPRRYIA